MRKKFFIYGFLLFLIVAVTYYYTDRGFLLVIILPILLVVGVYNAIQTKHAILRNFPVLGYFRYLFEMIAPEIQQYFIERSTDGKKPAFFGLSKS
jgi:hypothetical protein